MIISHPRGDILVDDADFASLPSDVWIANRVYCFVYYAGTCVHLGRYLMGLSPGDRREVDHINRNTLDNRRSNLRVVSRGENLVNRSTWGAIPHHGISFDKQSSTFCARVRIHGEIFRKNFKILDDAIEWRRETAIRVQGEFAQLDYP